MLLRRAPEIRVPLDAAADAGRLPAAPRLAVVLSSRLAHATVLPWTAALSADADWVAYARHLFASAFGAQVEAWEILVSDARPRSARLACAVDASLLARLRADGRVVSIQPRLMEAYNRARRQFADGDGWLVVPESGRVLLALIAGRQWKHVRVRQISGDLANELPALLARETAIAQLPECDRVVWAEAA